MDERVDVVVVGGGLAGLAAAATAARAGRSVRVLEAHQPGGRAQTVERGGYRLNQGPHALYEKGAGRAVLDRLGVRVTGSPPPLEGAMARRGEELVPFPAGARALLTSPLLGLRSRVQAGQAMAVLSRVTPSRHAAVSFQEWLAARGWRPDVEALFTALGRIASYCARPDELAADVVLGQLGLVLAGGVLYLDAGWQTMVDGLAAAASARGAEIRSHGTVRLVVPDRDAVEVHLADGRLLAGAVVLAAGAPAANAALLPDAPPWPAGITLEAACLDLGLAAPAPIPAIFGIDVPYYLVQHAPPAALAPAGAALVHVAEYLGAGVGPSLERLEEHARMAGIVPSEAVEHRYLHRMAVVSSAPTPATGGLAGRPGPVLRDHANVFLAGDWVGPTGFLADASLASGERAGALAAEVPAVARA